MHDPTRTETLACPRPDDLSAFHDGKLPSGRFEAVAAHVEQCDSCVEMLSTLDGSSDVLVRELRHPAEAETLAPEEASRASAIASGVRPPVRSDSSAGEGPRPGTLLGPYELVELLGEGGMGQVWRARQRMLGRDVAIKLIRAGQLAASDALARFQREIQLLARLDHPNVVRAEHADVIDGVPVLVMEFVPGVSLADHVRRQGVMPVTQACEALRQAALALQCAHDNGLVHRDVKPSNLLLTPDGTVKLLDLGLARAAGGPSTDELTAAGQVMGTFDYMAPEQWDDSRAVDVRADVYSLGCTAYFLLAGRPPFAEPGQSGRLGKMKAHALLPPPPLSQARPEVPDALAALVDRMLAKSPDDRIQTPGEVADLLQTIQGGGFVHLPTPPTPQIRPARPDDSSTQVAPPQPRRSVLPWLLAATVLGVVVGCCGLTGIGLAVSGLFALKPARNGRNDPAVSAMDEQVGEKAVAIRHPGPALLPPPGVEKASLVKAFRVKLSRQGEGERGELGKVVRDVRENDSARVEVELSERAYCYLIAFNTGGEGELEQLLWPATQRDSPQALDVVRYPANVLEHFGFTDGPGLQAFVLVVSRDPLPGYAVWKQKKEPIWVKAPLHRAWGIWYYDDEKLQLTDKRLDPKPPSRQTLACLATATFATDTRHGLAGVPWEQLRLGCRDTPAESLENLLDFFRKRPGVEVHAWGFAVAPSKEGK